MINNIKEGLSFIEKAHNKGKNQDNLNSILKKHGNFHKKVKSIHITGTNGKGSTSKMLSDILIKANYKVGLFTSPFIVVVNDRIRVNNNNISDQQLLELLKYFYQDIVDYNLNFFQIFVLLALKYFYDEKVDIAVIEVGIGGRLDATNVIDSILSIITNINYDHTDKLGSSLEAIAFEKAGIIKQNSPVITGVSQDNLLKTIKAKSAILNSDLIVVEKSDSKVVDELLQVTYNNKVYTVNTQAKYQGDNAKLTLAAVNVLCNNYGFKILDKDIRQALANFAWVGRYEEVSKNPRVILDGAHNLAGIKALIESSKDNNNTVVIFSALPDKSYKEMLELLQDNFTEVVFSNFNFYKSLSPKQLSELKVEKFKSFREAYNYLTTKYPDYDILVCGSLYFVSEVRKEFIKESNQKKQ